MCCGSGGDGAGSSPMAALADTSGRPSDDTVYVVTYFNGVTEEATGLDAVRRLLMYPAGRVEGAQSEDDFPPNGTVLGGTYAPKR